MNREKNEWNQISGCYFSVSSSLIVYLCSFLFLPSYNRHVFYTTNNLRGFILIDNRSLFICVFLPFSSPSLGWRQPIHMAKNEWWSYDCFVLLVEVLVLKQDCLQRSKNLLNLKKNVKIFRFAASKSWNYLKNYAVFFCE